MARWAPEMQAQFVEAYNKEWKNLLCHGVVEFLTKEQQETLPHDRVFTLCA